MDLQDLIITPILLILIFGIAFLIKPRVTDKKTKGFYFIGLSSKIFGAIFLGLIYQYYYDGGDTFNYYYWGSKWIWEAFLDSPVIAFDIIVSPAEVVPRTYEYTSHMVFYGSGGADFVSRLAGLFAIFTFNTYSAIAIIFAIISFLGSWSFFSALTEIYPSRSKFLGLAIFALPSIVIWGSGLLKDTLMLAAVCLVFGSLIRIFYLKRNILINSIIILFGLWLTSKVKIYISLCLIPSIIFFLYLRYLKTIKSVALKLIIVPFLIAIVVGFSYLAIMSISQINSKYSMNNIAKTAEATARWHSYVSEEVGGAGYTLGDSDYSSEGIVKKILPAINVTLFRPYLWEANSLFMLLSALESMSFLIFFIALLIKRRFFLKGIDPIVLSMILFSATFAFAIGAVTYNFGALVRYKVPILPLFATSLVILYFTPKSNVVQS